MSVYLKENYENFVLNKYKKVITAISSVAKKHNKKIYLIGGVVRDIILEKEVKDIDITIEDNAIEFSEIIKQELNCEIISVQDNLKTVKIKFNNGIIIDFASTREEKYIKSGSLPIAYNFGCKLKEDVKRRDFTINTLAICLSGDNEFSLIDYFNGYNDILNKKIRILHNNSFIDDPSRIIRALKFKVRFDFDYENNTFNLMHDYLKNIDYTIPLERIKNELKQYFSIPKKDIYKELIEINAYKLITENPVKNINENLFNKILEYKLYNNNNKWLIYLIFLCLNNKKNERLNLSCTEKRPIEEIRELIGINALNKMNNYELYTTFKNKTDLALAAYYIMTQNESVIKYITSLRDIELEISGKDLTQLGLAPSPLFGEIFTEVLKLKLEGNLKTKSEEITYIKNHFINN